MVESKSRKVLGENLFICRSHKGKTVTGGIFGIPPWIELNIFVHISVGIDKGD